MLCSRLSTALLLAAMCLLMDSGCVNGSLQAYHKCPTAVIQRAITCGEDNVQRLSCDSGVITVLSAVYGRSDRETCSEGRPPHQLANTECSQLGTLHILKKSCDGKKECELNIITLLRTSDPCYGTLKYLDTTYACHPGSHSRSFRSVACEDSFVNLHCDRGQVISVQSAYYGRRDRTTCAIGRPAPQVQLVTCSQYIHKVAQSCNGKTSCFLKVKVTTLGDPCFGTYKYLEVIYTCHYPVFHP